jgi:hypothetical protein
MKNLNLPRHLRRQLPSAEANFEGCHKDNISISQGHIYTRCPGKDAIGTCMFQIFIQLIISGNRKLNLKAHFRSGKFCAERIFCKM